MYNICVHVNYVLHCVLVLPCIAYGPVKFHSFLYVPIMGHWDYQGWSDTKLIIYTVSHSLTFCLVIGLCYRSYYYCLLLTYTVCKR